MSGWSERGQRLWVVGAGVVGAGVVILVAVQGSVAKAETTAIPTTVVGEPASAASAAASAAAQERPRWEWPFAPSHLSRGFESPVDRYSAGHRGIDIASTTASAVRSPNTAIVRFVGRVVDRSVVTLDHGDGVLSSYEPLDSSLVAGDTVTRGHPLGVVATGGHCADACLHVGLRVDGEYVSPLLFFERVPPSILLPLGR
ncbi:hypothetical protein LLS1_09910 [Leifsonia sp. LS1]|uniref:murein hydrolase activator EnvC family protein n=1 Tax=Leifsonia sp. LS1 TaxID=2828483 RepID=UPI001CFDDC1D|nr:M23 family metallopeptidase [Leifsonia sp. LS1]GIT79322.1 hypothetical protein LLS1_09910 [Leifsonia sp. LS1]